MLVLPAFEVVRPRSLAEAMAALSGTRDGAMLVAGGTDLLPNLKMGLYTPKRVVSLKRVAELRGLEETADGGLRVGASVTLRELATNQLVRRKWPAFAAAAELVAAPQIRNVATLGGNLCLDTRCVWINQSTFWRGALGGCLKKDGDVCHVVAGGKKCVAAFSADTPLPLMTYGATARLVSLRGERVLPVAELYHADGVFNQVRAPDEVLVDVRLPPPPPGLRAAFCKLRTRGSIDFGALTIALAVRQRPDETLEHVELQVGVLGARPKAVSGLDTICAGRRVDRGLVDQVGARARAQCHPLTNVSVDPEWRRDVIPVWVRRAFDRLG